jgi:hypothetical protein
MKNSNFGSNTFNRLIQSTVGLAAAGRENSKHLAQSMNSSLGFVSNKSARSATKFEITPRGVHKNLFEKKNKQIYQS